MKRPASEVLYAYTLLQQPLIMDVMQVHLSVSSVYSFIDFVYSGRLWIVPESVEFYEAVLRVQTLPEFVRSVILWIPTKTWFNSFKMIELEIKLIKLSNRFFFGVFSDSHFFVRRWLVAGAAWRSGDVNCHVGSSAANQRIAINYLFQNHF